MTLLRRCFHRLGVGRRAFVDCGSNTGAVLLDRIRLGVDDEFYAFEPQPELAASEDEVRRQHPDALLQCFRKAVWVEDGVSNLFLATRWGPNHRGGSTLLAGHVRNTSEVDYRSPVAVECIDFSRWVHHTFRKIDHVVVKMDIEGAEYAVLEKMLQDGSIDYISELIVEFHWQMNETLSRERHEALVRALEGRVVLKEWH
ncbi:MAG TPA: FkbM family methyltransferase [Thermoanaerobaculia bacterium]|nr:FkbM family methyltransferase [Thermoanaerobaculia bacterium]